MTLPLDEAKISHTNAASLGLVEASGAERYEIWTLNAESFRGPLSPAMYVEREKFLSEQSLTANGGIAFWALKDLSKPVSERSILSSCETIRKRALLKTPGESVKEITVLGIASVFSIPTFRGRGYATAMMKLLSARLDKQYERHESHIPFTILYSDIGKDFYSRLGWRPYESKHINLEPATCCTSPRIRLLLPADMEAVCKRDEQMLRNSLEKTNLDHAAVLMLPDHNTMTWLHAREKFVAEALARKLAPATGAEIVLSRGDSAWCIWSCFFTSQGQRDTLHILRFVVEGGIGDNEDEDPDPDSERYQAALLLLRAAQNQASECELSQVQIWNPTPLMIKAAQEIQPLDLIDRETESIASLRIGPQADLKHPVRWLANEKFSWC